MERTGVAVGDVLAGRYRVLRELGEGGMALVYEGEHVRLGQRVALKLVRPELTKHPEIMERFEREGRAVSRLRSPHVARVFDVDVTEAGVPFLAMELLLGHDLASELEARGPLPVDEALRWVRQACAAVIEAHEHGVIHRDLKPSNLFLSETPSGSRVLKVLDFGIATDPTLDDRIRITRTETMMGTPAYMAPEQFRSAKCVDARADVWALGATLFELLSGVAPFVGTATTIGIVITNDPLPDLTCLRADLPSELVAVVARALAKDREDRFASVRDFERELAALSNEPEALAEVGTPPSSETGRSAGAKAPPATAFGAPLSTRAAATGAGVTTTLKPPRRRTLVGVALGVVVSASVVLSVVVLNGPKTPSAATSRATGPRPSITLELTPAPALPAPAAPSAVDSASAAPVTTARPTANAPPPTSAPRSSARAAVTSKPAAGDGRPPLYFPNE